MTGTVQAVGISFTRSDRSRFIGDARSRPILRANPEHLRTERIQRIEELTQGVTP